MIWLNEHTSISIQREVMTNILDSISSVTNTVVYIDGSYFNFHRYYSLLRWWKSAYPDDPLLDPLNTPLFMDKYRKTHVENVMNITKKLGIESQTPAPVIIVGKDCKREDIWRNEFIQNYKGGRKNNVASGFMGGPVLKAVYDENLFQKAGIDHILHHPKLEGDDCIAISVRHMINTNEKTQIFIITSDKDYLQLAGPRVKIFDLSFKNLAEQKSSFKDADCDLFCKIVMGDVSDNIPSALKKCGPKTALKCYENKEYFDMRMQKENAYDKLENNRKIIDFKCIPTDIVGEFMNSIQLCN